MKTLRLNTSSTIEDIARVRKRIQHFSISRIWFIHTQISPRIFSDDSMIFEISVARLFER
jgi:hypothetical protein